MRRHGRRAAARSDPQRGACLIVDVDPARLHRRVEHRYLDEVAPSLDEAVSGRWPPSGNAAAGSVGVVGNAAEVFPELLRRGVEIDIVTDQTSAHDPLSYLPVGISVEDWAEYAEKKPEEFTDRARESMARHVEAMVGFMDGERRPSTTATRSATRPASAATTRPSPSRVRPGLHPAALLRGEGPVPVGRALRRPQRYRRDRRGRAAALPGQRPAAPVDARCPGAHRLPGLAGADLLARHGERDRAGLAFNDLVASGAVSAPIVIGRDHLDCGSVASPYRETEAMADGSDAIADWPLLNALTAASSGATWVSIHHGGGVGIGRSIHAGQVSVADGTTLAAEKLARVLTNDPGMGSSGMSTRAASGPTRFAAACGCGSPCARG